MLRLIGVGGVIAYRALFNWTTPAMFIGTLLVGPVFQLVFFAFLGRQLAVGSDHFYIVGNAVLASSGACVFGGVMAVSNERRYGTLGPVLLSPRSRTAIFLGRALPYAANGLLIATTTLLGGVLVMGVPVPASALPGLLLAFTIGSVSCAFFGLALGAIGLRFRDVWLVSNVAVALMLLLTGVNVPAAALPEWMRTVGSFVPITHAAEAARRLVAGGSLGESVAPLAAELVVGVAYAGLAAVLLKIFEAESRRRRASLDTL
jgi:ABC-2 type transport system permease protein